MNKRFLRRVSWVGGALALVLAAAVPALADSQFTTTANPISVGPPVRVPNTKPVVVPIITNHAFNGPNPATTSVQLPKGQWSEVVLTVTGSESGRQYDRLCQIWAGGAQIFNGVTPEPTPQGIQWTVKKDVTDYLPELTGNQTFTTAVDNYVSSVDNGVPNISATLSFYPAKGQQSQDPNRWTLPTPTSIVPLANQAGSKTLNAGKTWTTTVTLPDNMVGAYLDLNATAQIGEEFWWDNQPAFREIEISIDGKPAGLVWPFPYIYTGGVNPLIWRPITAIHTLDMPAYEIDLTPFAGMLHGTHTISITVLNNTGYWLMNGSLFLYQKPGAHVTGTVTKDTLKFPTVYSNATSTALNSSSGVSLQNDTASTQYTIQGTINGAGPGPLTATVQGSSTFSNDQTNTGQDYWGLVHGAQYTTLDESLTGPGVNLTRDSQDAYTVDSGSSFYQVSSGFFLPANVTQSLNQEHQTTGFGAPYTSSLYENVQGYGALQEASKNISQGATTGVAMFHDSTGYRYHAFIMARGGSYVVNQVSSRIGRP
ncbi:peptide-N4-asparagine amidase [Sulfobacillus harzensis]|uniref:Peptide N-acetyl-beta-D-glucosaminyl asparaginase amidase A N-terminal domain-containing protein n=1 Tax=Sulfobacillus harzensis TaxID=2729629 RepID=A0A7Y0Q2K3_9FIRM|nr:peptide-N4-asparagine amidase [Sulfobacillus harzensis]NMP23283.1 hypothetical protein [Sulfobacillus harzensis]